MLFWFVVCLFVVFASNWIAMGLVGAGGLVWLLFWLIGLVVIVRDSCALGLMFWLFVLAGWFC